MNDKELWKLISIISEGQDSEQRRQVEQYITDLQKEIERLNNIINKVYEYLDKKKDVPEWWDTDFMICMNILKGGTGYLKDILGSDKNV